MITMNKWTAGLLLGLLPLAVSLLIPTPDGFTTAQFHTLCLALMMVIWWIFETLPLAITSCVPLALFPLYHLSNFKETAVNYAHPIIFLLLGGFMIGKAIEHSNLHKRITLVILTALGDSPKRHAAGLMITTAFFSLWVSNSATTILMLPIAMGLIEAYQADSALASTFLLAVMYAANIGGMGTLIGTPPNAFVAGFLADDYHVHIHFFQWSLLSIPLVCLLLIAAWAWLCLFRYKKNEVSNTAVKAYIKKEQTHIGTITKREICVGTLLIVTATTWMARPWINHLLHTQSLTDAGIAMTAAILLFIIPIDLPSRRFLINWHEAKTIPWGILLLVGGGFSLASIIQSSGLGQWLAAHLELLSTVPLIIQLSVSTLCIMLLTEINSNTATTMTFTPLLALLAINLHIPATQLVIPAAYAASCAFMLPIATPPNAIVYSSEKISMQQMLRSGIIMNALAWVLIISYALLMFKKIIA